MILAGLFSLQMRPSYLKKEDSSSQAQKGSSSPGISHKGISIRASEYLMNCQEKRESFSFKRAVKLLSNISESSGNS